jgi:beta-mannanase
MNTNSSAWGGAHNFGKDSRQTWIQADSLTKCYGDPNKPDGPERYVDAWKRVRRIFGERGATNVLFLWSPLYDNYPKEKWNEVENYYPGDEYVDLVGCSLYNEGYWEEESKYGKWWRDFEDSMYLASWPIGLRVRGYTGLYYGRTETDRKKTDPLRRC